MQRPLPELMPHFLPALQDRKQPESYAAVQVGPTQEQGLNTHLVSDLT
jgi:hypothetical protein